MHRVSVVVPALNEAKNLPRVLPLIPRWAHEVILVDGKSTDGTSDVARATLPGIRVVEERHRGKGLALRAGFEAATGDIIVMLDADGSTDPREIPLFIEALTHGADLVKGSRFLPGGGTLDMPFHRQLGNSCFVAAVRVLFGGRFTDLCYGYMAFWTEILPRLQIDAIGFEVETQIALRALRAGLRVSEVPSFEKRRIYGEGNLRTIPDGLRVTRQILRERFRSPIPRGSRPAGEEAPVVGIPIMPAAAAPQRAQAADLVPVFDVVPADHSHRLKHREPGGRVPPDRVELALKASSRTDLVGATPLPIPVEKP
jgi:glycosyltransferase involved in cell wall biosynthesis